MNDPAVTVVALLITGYLLVTIEVLLIPGIGFAGVGGFLCLGAGCYFSYHYYGPGLGTATVVGVLASTTAALYALPKTRFGRGVVHSADLGDAHTARSELEPGQIGVAESALRPAGVARFGELRQSVVTEGEFIPAQSEIVVTEVQGARVVVELVPRDAAPGTD